MPAAEFAGGEYGVFVGADLFKKVPSKDYLIEGLLYEGDVICISAKAGVGKSILAMQLMGCLTSGTTFLESYHVARPCNVLYVQTEGDRAETLERIELMQTKVPMDHTRWAHMNLPGIMLNDPVDYYKFTELVKAIPMMIDVVILDPLYTTIKGNMNDNQVATDWIRNIRELKGWLQCAVIVLNHENKDVYHDGSPIEKGPGSVFGSTFWAAFFNQNYKLRTYDKHFILEIGKNRSGKAVDRVQMTLMNTDTLMYVPWDPDLTSSGQKVTNLLRAGKPVTMRRIVEITGVSKASCYRLLRKWVDSGEVSKEATGRDILFSWKSS